MAKSDRLFRLMQLLRSEPAPVTAGRLAAALEVSPRTLYRDIETLRAAGALIDGAAGLGYTLIEDMALPPQTLTRLEIEALSFGLMEAQFRGDQELAAAAKDALTKITATLTQGQQREALHSITQVYRYTRPETAEVDLSDIRAACWREEEIDITYRDLKDQTTRRRVRPLAILYFERAVTLLAYCTLRDDFRLFRVAHISNVQQSGTSFRPDRVRLIRDYVDDLKKKLAARGDGFTFLPPQVS